MSFVEYVESEKQWRSLASTIPCPGLGVAILENLKKGDPSRVYEVLHDTRSHVTAKQIHDQTITVAQNLLNLGVKKNDTVVFFSMCNLKITPLNLACYTIGAPVCFFETYLEQEFVPHYLDMLKPTVIFYEDRFKSMVFNGLNGLKTSTVKHMISLDGTADQNNADELLFKPTVDIENFQIPKIEDPAHHPAILALTSGSTGLPKVIIQSHSMMQLAVYNFWQPKPGVTVTILSELRWMCQMLSMLQPALLGVKRIYSSTPPFELTGEFVRELIDINKVSHYFEVPKFYLTVLNDAERSQDPSSLSSLKLVVIVGESAGEAFEEYFKKITPNCEMGRAYALTESGALIASSMLASKKSVNGGALLNCVLLQIVDVDGKPLGPNEHGRILVKLATVPFLGYLSNKKANKETFTDDGWLDTGDLGMMDSDNLLHVFTREKYALRYADGKLLMPYKIENLVTKFDGVKSSALVGRPSEENPKQDCGTIFVVLNENVQSGFDEKEFLNYLRTTLTKEELRIVKCVKVLEDLPATTCYKVDRMKLKKMFDGSLKI